MENLKHTGVYDKVIWVLTSLLFASFYLFNLSEESSRSLIIITVILFLLYCIRNKSLDISLGRFHFTVLAFSAYCFLSSLWATEPQYAIEKGITIVKILVCISVVYMLYQDKESINTLLGAIIAGGNIVAYYTIIHYGFNNMQNLFAIGSRLGTEFANTNSVGMLMAITIVLTLSFALFYGIRPWQMSVIGPVLVLAITESRTAFAEVILGVAFLLFIKNKSSEGLNKIKSIIIAVLVVAGVYLLLSNEIFRGMNERMEGVIALITGKGTVDGSAAIRQKLVNMGLGQFLRTPVFGMGMGNARILTNQLGKDYYLHNNFADLLAGGGIIGFSIYYSMHFYIIYGLIKKRKYLKKTSPQYKSAMACLTVIVIHFFADYGTVSYAMKDTYFYLAAGFLCIRSMERCIERQNVAGAQTE